MLFLLLNVIIYINLKKISVRYSYYTNHVNLLSFPKYLTYFGYKSRTMYIVILKHLEDKFNLPSLIMMHLKINLIHDKFYFVISESENVFNSF